MWRVMSCTVPSCCTTMRCRLACVRRVVVCTPLGPCVNAPPLQLPQRARPAASEVHPRVERDVAFMTSGALICPCCGDARRVLPHGGIQSTETGRYCFHDPLLSLRPMWTRAWLLSLDTFANFPFVYFHISELERCCTDSFTP